MFKISGIFSKKPPNDPNILPNISLVLLELPAEEPEPSEEPAPSEEPVGPPEGPSDGFEPPPLPLPLSLSLSFDEEFLVFFFLPFSSFSKSEA